MKMRQECLWRRLLQIIDHITRRSLLDDNAITHEHDTVGDIPDRNEKP
ncbi:hypothetical protein [Brucella haematophila]|nr:hypothetical protein [Brucella haematophila]